VDGGAGVSHIEEFVRHAADLSQARRNHSRPRVVQLPRPCLEKELEDRIANIGKPAAASDNAENGSWPDVLADLDSLTETEVEQDGKRFLLRSAPRPAASLALRAAGVALPPTVRQLADA
jgi:hypothetical protein